MAHVYNSQLDAFDLYHQVQEVREPKNFLGGPALPALGHATAGSIGAAISNVVTYPLALIVTRLQIQRSLRKRKSESAEDEYRSLKDAAQKIYADEGGLSGLYAGLGPDTAKTIADSFLFFLAYNFLRQTRLRARGGSTKYLPVVDELGVGFFAGAFSKFLTTPIANIVTRQQAASMMSRTQSRTSSHSSIRETALQIRNEKGLQGFWSGYSASLVLTLNPSLTFFLFEFLKRLLVPRNKRSDPPAQTTFLIAAVSKAVASTITYPFSLAKSRAQASSRSGNAKEDDETGAAEGKKENMGSESEKTKAQMPSNVFGTILSIARAEGLGALYEGLGGDVLKGFFSHGITMIVKQIVHRFIIQLYHATLRLLKRFPSPEDAAQSSKERTKQAFEKVHKDAEPSVSSIKERLQGASSTLRDSGQDALDKAQHEAGTASAAMLKRIPSPEAEVQGSKERTKQAFHTVQENAKPLMSSTTAKLQDVSSTLLDGSQRALDKVQKDTEPLVSSTTAKLQDASSSVLDSSQDALNKLHKDTEPLISSTTEKLHSISSTLPDSSQDALKKAQLNTSSASNTLSQEASKAVEKPSEMLKKTKDQYATVKREDEG
ncbi:MAG: hypothetical protein Q9221_001981 [Calogaya cf. arnoldii]